MEAYPSIGTTILGAPIYAFDKLDGSNIRAEWTRKGGFAKFGTRHRLLDADEPVLGEAIPLFMEKYADDLEAIFRKERFEKTTAFFEFYGENSFAGLHEDEPHTVTLFDLHVYKKGLMAPRDFMRLFDNVETAPLLYGGIANKPFIESVRNSELDGMTFEGVICKGGYDNRNRLMTFKVKSQAWLDRLKNKYGHDEKLYNSLV